MATLNRNTANSFTIKSRKHRNTTLVPQGPLLLYAYSQIYNCRVYLFSSRAIPTIIHPAFNSSKEIDTKIIAVLQRSDSFTTEWFALDLNATNKQSEKKPENVERKKPEIFDNNITVPAARLRKVDDKKPRQPAPKNKTELDEEISKYLREEVQTMYHKKWMSISAKHQGKSGRLEAFSKEVSSKSLPTGVANIIQAKIEWNIRNNKYADFESKDIPECRVWVQQRINKLKKENFTVDQLKASFIEEVQRDNDVPIPSTFALLENDASNEEEEVDEIEANEDEYRAISRTLAKVIRPEFNYDLFLKTLEE
ncbi:unnamed protein product [Mucor hiemalis]